MAGDPPGRVGGQIQINVSIRARHRWRAIQRRAVGVEVIPNVSIRARHRWRAILQVGAQLGPRLGFQSAPAIDGGRSLFEAILLLQEADVSIRARHRWRAIRPR